MSDYGNFEIEDGVLIEYTGEDKNVSIPHEVYEIGENAFDGNDEICEVTVPHTVRKIDECAFDCCKNLKKVRFFGGLREIEPEAFWGAENLGDFTLPDTLKRIGHSAFHECAVKKLRLPDSLEYLDDDAFSDCKSLESVEIGANLAHIGVGVFSGCENLKSITVHRSNKNFTVSGGCLIDVNAKKLLYALPDFVLPADGQVTTFGNSCMFARRELTELEIPACIEKIENFVFDECTSLSKVTVDKSNAHYSEQDGYVIENASGKVIFPIEQ